MCASPVEGSPVTLSRRELEIAGLVAQGLTNREIAARLFISERTVDGHLEHVREKLGVNTRAQIATWVVSQRAATAEPVASHPPSQPVSQPVQRRGGIVRRRWWIAAALVLAVAASVLVAELVRPSGPRIETVAGTQSVGPDFPGGGYSNDGYLARNAELSRPSDVGAGPGGTIYIADQHQVVREITPDGNIRTVAGTTVPDADSATSGRAATSVRFGYLSNVAVDKSGRLLLLTNMHGILQVWRVGTDTLISLVVSLGPSSGGGQGFWHMPVGGLAVASDGTIYISERAENKVWKLGAGESVPTLYAGLGPANFSGDLAAAKGAELDSPLGLALDQHQNLYIADAGNNRIRRVDHTTKIITTVAGSGEYYGDAGDGGPATSARLAFPFGVAVRADGTVFIADTGNNRLRVISPSGRIAALAGSGLSGLKGDGGPASQAELSGPEAVGLDASGNLLVADTENHRVRELMAPLP